MRPNTTVPGFGTIAFMDKIPCHDDPSIEVPCGFFGILPSGARAAYFGYKAGLTFQISSHAHAEQIIVVDGTGTFHIGGFEYDYSPGSSFTVPPNAPHAFTHVKTYTVVINRSLTTEQTRPTVSS